MTKTNNSRNHNGFIGKLGAGLMASLCAFSMLATPMTGVLTASAASTATENEAFPSADEVIAQAATLLGSPYGRGFKGYTGVYYQDSYSPLSLDYVRQRGVDCSGLIYYKEIKAPTGYDLDSTVYTLTSGKSVTVNETRPSGTIIVNKTAEDGVTSDRKHKVSDLRQ